MRNNCVLVCVPTKFLNPKDGKLLEIHRYKPHDHSLLKPYINVFVKWWFSITCCKTKTKDLKITKYQEHHVAITCHHHQGQENAYDPIKSWLVLLRRIKAWALTPCRKKGGGGLTSVVFDTTRNNYRIYLTAIRYAMLWIDESMNQCYTLYVMNVYCDQIMSHDLLWTFLA